MARTFPAVFVEGARHADEAVLAGSRSAKECYFIVTQTRVHHPQGHSLTSRRGLAHGW